MSAILSWTPVSLLGAALAVAWAVFLGGGLRSVWGWIALLTAVPVLSLLVLLGTAVAAIVRPRHRRPLRLAVTAVACGLGLWPGGWNLQLLTIPYPFHLATSAPPATVRLPLDGPVRVFWGGDDLEHNRHAAFPDQRWAYDLTVEPAATGSSRLEDYGCYGKDVVAPTAGEVWMAHDGEPEQTPGKLVPNFRAPLGNDVVLRLPSGTFLILAHLQTGSVAVHEGAHVEEGEVVGRCGDTGNTSEPHVHIHHQRQDPRTYPVNFAEGLPLYFRDHDGAAMPQGGVSIQGEKVTPTGDVVRHVGPSRHAPDERADAR